MTTSPRRGRFLSAWVVVLAAIYMTVGFLAVRSIHDERRSALAAQETRMSPTGLEAGLTPPDPIPATGDFVPVTVGLYLDGIETMSIRDSFWNATFYVWFRWQGDRALNPGASFRLVDGRIERRELMDERTALDGSHYQRFRVTARMTKFFNTTRVPLDSHMLNIYVEDGRLDVSRMRYVAGPDSSISSRVRVSGYRVTGFRTVVKPHTYRSAYGDPSVAPGTRSTFTEFVVGVNIERSGPGVYLKVFIGLFAGMALALTSFALRAADAGPRFSMLAGAYFGAVANSYLAGSLIPSSGQFGLVEYVTFLGLFTIFLSLIATVVSAFIWNTLDDRPLSRRFDRWTVVTIGLGYVAINLALPWFA